MTLESKSGAPLPHGGNDNLGLSQNEADNPLLSMGFDIPFAAIRPEHVEPAAAALLAQARSRIEAIEDDTSEPTYDNTLGLLDTATEPLERAMGGSDTSRR
jgi:Zn-dependent oligopeptidase